MTVRHLHLECMAAAASFLVCLVPAVAGQAAPRTGYTNPVLFADYSDPDVIRSGRYYYLVASSFHLSPGIPILRSRDLIHWTIVGHVLPRLPFAPEYDLTGTTKLTDSSSELLTSGTRYGGGPWAPSIRKHANKFFVYWATPREGIFMATARRPEGPWSAPVKVIDQPLLEDPCPFWDDDGTAWLIHSRVGAGPLILHRMSEDGTRVLDPGTTIVQDAIRLPVLEGPKLYKRNGWYYIFAPIGGVATGPQAVGRARRIEGPYEWRDVLLPGGPLGLKGPHQGGWVETPDGRGWFLHFNQTGAFGRIVHLQPLRWENDWPVIGAAAPEASAGFPVAGGPAPVNGGTRDRLQGSDDFSSPRLGLQWAWNHNPDDRAWSLRARPGFLRLAAGRSEHLVTARNTLTQVMQGPAPTYTLRFDTSGMAEGQRAGLSMFNAGRSWIGVVRLGGRTKMVSAALGAERILAELPARWVQLRARVSADEKVTYSYSLDDGRTFTASERPALLTPYAWWKGTRPAVFTFNTTNTAGWIDVDWFHVANEDSSHGGIGCRRPGADCSSRARRR